MDDVLRRSVIGLLRPLVRLLLKRGVAHGEFVELSKEAYVESAQLDFAVPGRKPSISRVAVLTGLTRKEASRLVRQDVEPSEAPARRRVNRAARVVSAWVGDRKYRDRSGRPASLPVETDDGPSFSALVTEHGGDVTPRAVLDELTRVGAIRRLKDGRVRLVQRAYIPESDETAKLEILGTDVADLLASIEHNLEPESTESYFQRKVAYDNLPPDYLETFRSLLARKGQRFLEELNAELAAHDRDVTNEARGEGRRRAMVGVYYFEEPVDEDDD